MKKRDRAPRARVDLKTDCARARTRDYSVRVPAGFQGRRTSRLLSKQRKEGDNKKKKTVKKKERERERGRRRVDWKKKEGGLEEKNIYIYIYTYIGKKRDANIFHWTGMKSTGESAQKVSLHQRQVITYTPRDAGIQGGGELPG